MKNRIAAERGLYAAQTALCRVYLAFGGKEREAAKNQVHIDLNGLVLVSEDARENDKYLTVLTDKIGKVRVAARGVNKNFGGMCPCCQPFSYSKMTLFENRGRYQLDCSELITQFAGISSDIERLALCSYFSEAAGAVSYEGIDSAEVLRLCLFAFNSAAKRDKRDLHITKAAFELRLMSLCGYMPETGRCCICGKPRTNVFFDIKKGNTYCEDCRCKASSANNCITLTVGALDAVNYTLREDIPKIFGFGLGQDSARWFGTACEAYLLSKTEKRFKTLDFYKSLQYIGNYAEQALAAKKAADF